MRCGRLAAPTTTLAAAAARSIRAARCCLGISRSPALGSGVPSTCRLPTGHFFCTQAKTPAEAGVEEARLHEGLTKAPELTAPKPALLRKHFLVCAVPMVGFGIMDNSIMIHAGDLIDSTVGLYLGLATLGAAACGQVVSDVCGVCFGGTVEALASKAGMTPPPLSLAQRDMRVVKLTGTAGAAVGVFCGCCIGMLNLLFLDLDKKEKLKRKKELETIFETVAETSENLIGVERSSIWLLDHHEGKGEGTEPYLWTVAATGIDQVIKVPIGPGAPPSLVAECAAGKAALNVPDCYADRRFNSDVDKATGFRTKSMLCVPVLDEEKQLHGVVQLINKRNGEAFNIEDERLCRMLATHVAVFVKHTGDE